MTDSPGVQRVTAAGDPYDLGFTHGRQAAALVRAVYELRMRRLTETTGDNERTALSRATVYRQFAVDHVPELMEEVRGIADGAEISFEQAFYLQVATEVAHDGFGCSAVGMPGAAEPILAQNWDPGADFTGKQILLHLKPTALPEILTFGPAGVVGYIGLNSAGCGHVQTGLYPGRPTVGLGQYFINRKLFSFETVDQGIAWLAGIPTTSLAAFLIGDAGGTTAAIEIGAGSSRRLPANAVVIHTNHCLDPDLARGDEFRRFLPDSEPRLARLHDLLAGAIGEEDVIDALRDHSGYPRSVCRHEGGSGLVTVASIVLRLRAREMLLAMGTPCTSTYTRFRFDC